MSTQKCISVEKQKPKPPTLESGQRQFLKQPSLRDTSVEAARNESQGSPPGCSPADSRDTRLSYSPTLLCAVGTPVSPAETGEQDIRRLVNQLTISVSAAAKLLGLSENQAHELASRSDFLVLDHGGHEAVNILRLIYWVEHQAVTDRKGRD